VEQIDAKQRHFTWVAGEDGVEHWTRRPGFTLPELLAVIAIILLVSIVALPTILPAVAHRQVGEAARILQSNLAGARDAAIRDNAPRGIRLLPDPVLNGIGSQFLPGGVTPNPLWGKLDPSQPLASNRMIPIGAAPDYNEGRISVWTGPGLPSAVAAIPYSGPGTAAIPNPTWGHTGALMVFQAVAAPQNGVLVPNAPTSWFWNIRVGDTIQIANAGPRYTIVGPVVQANSELYINVGPPGTQMPLLDQNGLPAEFLLLVNGRDDNKNGWTDEGWDGVDNDGKNGVDDVGEWEVEKWLGALGGN